MRVQTASSGGRRCPARRLRSIQQHAACRRRWPP